MNYQVEFRNPEIATALSKEIHKHKGTKKVKIMEVCGGHTISIFKYGLKSLLPDTIDLVSGPGCPVCVTPNHFIDYAIELSKKPNIIIATFGDMIRVPGSRSSLLDQKAMGADVRICYSTLNALDIARKNPDKNVVFLGIGFETTAPTVALSMKKAKAEGLKNYYVLCGHKTMPDAMKALLDENIAIHAFIAPGHVSTITGIDMYDFLPKNYKTPVVVSGFEPLDLLQSILMIMKQFETGNICTEIQYKRVTKTDGNKIAQNILYEVFEACDVAWRGLGDIPNSGLTTTKQYEDMDAEKVFPLKIDSVKENPACQCGNIMKGLKTPLDCKLFSKSCTPESPKGSCMVSDEGTCATYYKYRKE